MFSKFIMEAAGWFFFNLFVAVVQSLWILEQPHPLYLTPMLPAKPELLTPGCHLREFNSLKLETS
ncbi:MAG: hypothetical protein Q7U88_17030 [Desulfocapsaceae bacterium]|nr:hypothetical protein [Desulfocapsaceae bacterium]